MLHNHVAYEQSEDACTLPHCLTHQMFSMNVEERVIHTLLLLLLLLDSYCEL